MKRRHQHRATIHCGECGHSTTIALNGCTAIACPECGIAIDLSPGLMSDMERITELLERVGEPSEWIAQ